MATIAETTHERGMAKALLRLLERRFGTASAELRKRVGDAEQSETEAWLDAVVNAPDLEAVFRGGCLR